MTELNSQWSSSVSLAAFDQWFWEGSPASIYTREEKRQNFLKANQMSSDRFLRNFRFLSALCCYCFEAYYWYRAEVWWKSPLVYFTGWGWYSWLLYCAMISYAHIKYDIN